MRALQLRILYILHPSSSKRLNIMSFPLTAFGQSIARVASNKSSYNFLMT